MCEPPHRGASSVSIAERVLSILSDIADTTEVVRNPDLRLFDLEVLDSLRTVELMIALSEQFGVEISPAEFERDQWATPKRIVAYIERRLNA
jgi:D-alanine--poly(phosphoribitol) ligase subunit 2